MNLIKKIARWAMSEEIEKLNKLTREVDRFELDSKIKIEQLTHEVATLKKDHDNVKNMYGRLFEQTDVTVDVDTHGYGRYRGANSWAVISIQGERSDMIKFLDLRDNDIRDIEHFLRHFERGKIDAEYGIRNHLMAESRFIETRKNKDWMKNHPKRFL